eukprot:199904-Prymnesium_polylepis.1
MVPTKGPRSIEAEKPQTNSALIVFESFPYSSYRSYTYGPCSQSAAAHTPNGSRKRTSQVLGTHASGLHANLQSLSKSSTARHTNPSRISAALYASDSGSVAIAASGLRQRKGMAHSTCQIGTLGSWHSLG